MIKNTEPTEPTDTTLGGAKATPSDEDPFIERYDLTIYIGDLYVDTQEADHQEFPSGNVAEETPTTNVIG